MFIIWHLKVLILSVQSSKCQTFISLVFKYEITIVFDILMSHMRVCVTVIIDLTNWMVEFYVFCPHSCLNAKLLHIWRFNMKLRNHIWHLNVTFVSIWHLFIINLLNGWILCLNIKFAHVDFKLSFFC